MQIHVRFDRETNLARTPDLSTIDFLAQEFIEVVVPNVVIGSVGKFALLGALADLVDEFGDVGVQPGRSVPSLPRLVRFQTGPEVCS
jgi:hypothetical protein